MPINYRLAFAPVMDGKITEVCVQLPGGRQHVAVFEPGGDLPGAISGQVPCPGSDHDPMQCVRENQLPELVRQMLDPNAPRPHAMKLGLVDQTLAS